MSDLQLNQILESMDFTSDLYAANKVLVARHASIAHKFFTSNIESFEEYQRFQTSDNFGKCSYVVSFIGLPGKGEDATFAGIYKVLAKRERGQKGFRDPIGDPELLATFKEQKFLYELVRQKQFDSLQFLWDIRWNIPGPAKYQYLTPKMPIDVLRFSDCQDMAAVSSLVRDSALDTELSDEIAEGSAGFSEGAQFYARHLRRERSTALVKLVKEAAKRAGTYFCFVCKTDFQKLYGVDYIECHHTIPVSTLAPGEKTRIEDMVLLCANCHRAVHKRKPWLKKIDLQGLLLN